jgi:hypothetical protein
MAEGCIRRGLSLRSTNAGGGDLEAASADGLAERPADPQSGLCAIAIEQGDVDAAAQIVVESDVIGLLEFKSN